MQATPYLNLTVLLDLSDRNLADGNDTIIDPGQKDRDLRIISGILKSFEETVKTHGYMFSKDKLQIRIARQHGSRPVDAGLEIDVEEMVKESPAVRQKLPARLNDLMQQVKMLYDMPTKRTGGDIWSFVKDNGEQLICRSDAENGKEDKYMNKLIIITDGYLVFDQHIQQQRMKDNSCMQISKLRNDISWKARFDKYKLRTAGHDLKELDVLMLEANPVDPQVHTSEMDIIETYWKTWFEEMHAECRHIYQVDAPVMSVLSSVNRFLKE